MISILIMTYNGEKYISKCIDSLINQTSGLKDIEIIILDDCSTDSTLKIIEEYQTFYNKNIFILKNEKHSSITKKSNRNKAISHASGEHILFLDQDDWLESDSVEVLKNYIEKYPNLDYIEFGYQDINEENNTVKIHTCKNPGFNIYDIVSEEKRNDYALSGILPGATYAWNKLYRKDFLTTNNIYHNDGPQSSGFADNFFSGLLVMSCKKIAKLEKVLYNYRVYTGSYSHDKKKNSAVQFERCTTAKFFYQECVTRNLYENNREMTEYIFCRTFLLKTFWKFLLQYEPIPFDILIKIQKEMREKVPGYRNNKIMQNLEEMKDILDILDNDWCEDYLLDLRKRIEKERNMGIKREYLYLS